MKTKEILKKNTGRIGGLTLILIAIGIILVIAIIIAVNNGNKGKEATTPEAQTAKVVDTTRPSIEGDKYVAESNGVKVNTSSKLTENKTYGIYTFSNIRISTDKSGSVILANVTANATTKVEGKTVTIKIIDEQGKVVSTLGGYIGQIKPGETNTFRAETTTDITNAYDFIIE